MIKANTRSGLVVSNFEADLFLSLTYMRLYNQVYISRGHTADTVSKLQGNYAGSGVHWNYLIETSSKLLNTRRGTNPPFSFNNFPTRSWKKEKMIDQISRKTISSPWQSSRIFLPSFPCYRFSFPLDGRRSKWNEIDGFLSHLV